jgi:phosphate transport system substrate-binding protein
MKTSLCLFSFLSGLLLWNVPTVAATPEPIADESGGSLRWVGCGISKKAYLVALAKAYEEETGVKLDIQGGGATRGIRDVAGLTADIGGSCRRPIRSNPKEQGINMIPVAWDALVVIVHKDNPVDDITLDDLKKVYLGEVTNWSQLGGSDSPIRLLARTGKISGVGRTIRKLLFDNYEQDFANSEIFESSGPLEQTIETAPNALAMSGISSVRKRDVKILKLEGKEPSYENVATGEYLLYRTLYLVYNDDNPHVETIKDFIRFADTPRGRAVIRANGTIPYLEGLNLMKQKLQESRAAHLNEGLTAE